MMMPNPTDVKYLHRFFNAIGKAEWTESHHNYGTMGGYMKHRAEVNAAVEGIFRTKTAKEWDTVLQDAKVICAVAHNLDEVVKDKQLRANNAFVSITHPVQGKFETVNAPFNLHGSAVGPQGAAPGKSGVNSFRVCAGFGSTGRCMELLKSSKALPTTIA
eukprot:m.1337418 g.1337418  ORF g.1337418 m.1337418 type:complete len:160 (+) comp24882_c1_seq19:1253-1732(+)